MVSLGRLKSVLFQLEPYFSCSEKSRNSLCLRSVPRCFFLHVIEIRVGFERYRIFAPLSRVRILIPCLNWNKILLPGQMPLSRHLYLIGWKGGRFKLKFVTL